MQKKFIFAILFLFVIINSALAATTSTNVDYDPFHLPSQYTNSSDLGNGDSDFYYQLRDITGANWNSEVGGPQWFATVYENYYSYYDLLNNTNNSNKTYYRSIYRRTMGGEIDEIPVSVIGDILDGFNFVFAEEPEPYDAWTEYYYNNIYYDVYPDPLESLCVVITNGRADLNVKFANPYARHFPFWWRWTRTTKKKNWTWWKNGYDPTDASYATVEPIAYIYSPTDNAVYKGEFDTASNRKVYNETFNVVTSQDASSNDCYVITDTNKNNIFTSSGDITSSNFEFYSGDVLMYVISDDEVYDGDNNLVYTLESAGTDDTNVYICEIRSIGESIVVHGFDYYDVRVSPYDQDDIRSGQYLDTKINIAGDAYSYGSQLGYISFRQRASFAPGYRNFREALPIPMVIANVSNGNASDNPLIFDMAIFDSSDDVVKRVKFEWDAQSNISKNLGTFFMMTPVNADTTTPYRLETRITNRTGTRYKLYRYTSGNGGEISLVPAYWKYDLTSDVYGTLPESFQLDDHSQIAPGLITVYNEDMNYNNINMGSDTSASFRLYEYDSTNPKNLTLNYKRIAGMLTNAVPQGRAAIADGAASDDLVSVQGFSMYFTDVANNSDNTSYEIKNLTGKNPVMVNMLASEIITPYNTYINSSALDAFMISADVPPELQLRVSYDVVSYDTEAEDEESSDNDTQEENNDNQENNQENAENNTANLRAAQEIITYNTDSSGNMALQPISIRMKIARKTQLLEGIWDQLDEAKDPDELFNIFARYGTVWVRSYSTAEYDTNLFTAIDRKGSNIGVGAGDCVRAFIYNDDGEDYLYLDFIVIMADAVSKNSGKSAFIEIIKDDNVPYILIGDGLIDMGWNLSFYVGAAGENPMASSSGESTTRTPTNTLLPAGSGGGCSMEISGLILLALILFRKRVI